MAQAHTHDPSVDHRQSHGDQPGHDPKDPRSREAVQGADSRLKPNQGHPGKIGERPVKEPQDAPDGASADRQGNTMPV